MVLTKQEMKDKLAGLKKDKYHILKGMILSHQRIIIEMTEQIHEFDNGICSEWYRGALYERLIIIQEQYEGLLHILTYDQEIVEDTMEGVE